MNVIWLKEGSSLKIDEDLCCAIGNFDGVHLGHRQLINKSKEFNLKSAVLTFYPHPFTILKRINPYPQVTPIEHKIKIIESLGIEYLFIVEFTEDIANMEKLEFIKRLKDLGIKSVVCGYDFTFAKKASGTIKDLAEYFDFHEIPKFQIDNIRVSTTYVKELLTNGDMENASIMLGRNFNIFGKVIAGKELGRQMGFPTANINYGIYYLPKNGVYAVKVNYKNKTYQGMCNIGNNPTVDFSENIKMEVNIFDFNQSIYGEELEIIFYKRIRPEKKFNSITELEKQLMIDKNNTIEYFKEVEE